MAEAPPVATAGRGAPPGPPPTDHSLGQVVWAALGRWVLVLGGAILAGALADGALGRLPGVAPAARAAIATLAGQAAGAAVMLLAARRGLRALPPAPPPPGPRPGVPAAAALLAGAAAWGVAAAWLAPALRVAVLGAAATVLWPGDGAAAARAVAVADPATWGAIGAARFAVLAVLTPVAEERFFRHWLWRRLEPGGARRAALATAGLWLAAHLAEPATALALLPMAALLGWARWRTGSPRLGMGLHGAYNAAVLLAVGLPAAARG